MRRHSLEPDSIRRQLKSVLTAPSRKFFAFTNGKSSPKESTTTKTKRTRRFSVPDKKTSTERLDQRTDLHTIHEVKHSLSLLLFFFFLIGSRFAMLI